MMKYLFLFISILLLSCNKDWLDVKSNNSDVVPTKLEDLMALIDNEGVMNSNYPALPNVGSDNYYVTFTAWQARATAQERNAYIWASEIYEGEPGYDWNAMYQVVEYANIVLEGLEKIPSIANHALWNNAKGNALFFRAYAFYNLAQIFAKPYSASATSDPGIPIRTSTDVNERSVRGNLQQTYDRIIADLQEALLLLPENPLVKTRAAVPAVNALLARVYLNMEDYMNSEKYASAALTKFNSLINYNILNASLTYPLPTFQSGNAEVMFYSIASSFGIQSVSTLRVDSLLYRSYHANDLRKNLFYKDNGFNGISFRGNYAGTSAQFFSGLATNELFLIRAECFARNGKITEAMDDLNTLLASRWKTGTYTKLTAASQLDALQKIILEKRKELPFTGSLRWEELRRLNKDPRFAIPLVRVLNGQTYTLSPNDKRYVYPIPDNEIRTSKIEQNPR